MKQGDLIRNLTNDMNTLIFIMFLWGAWKVDKAGEHCAEYKDRLVYRWFAIVIVLLAGAFALINLQ
jgi:hypothetical protein